VFDPTTGALLKRIGNFPYDLKNLVFSPDGRRLAVTLGGNVVVLETENFGAIFHDDTLRDLPYGAAFGPDGALYVASLDSTIRKYGADGRRIAEVRLKELGRLYGLVVDPSGQAIALTSLDVPGVIVVDSRTLKPVGTLDDAGLPRVPLGLLAGSREGDLAAGGMFVNKATGRATLRIWHGASRTQKDVSIEGDNAVAVSACGRDFLIATASGQSLMRVDPEGRTQWRLESASLHAYGKVGLAFRVSADAQRLWFGLGQGADDPVEFDLAGERLFRNPAPDEGLNPPVKDLLPVTGWQDSPTPKLAGAPLFHERDEFFRSMAQLPDGSGLILGSEFQIWRFNRTGKVEGQWKPPAPVYGLNIPRDGKIFLAAYGDGTIRWHRLTDGAELLALYVDRRTLAWIVWTPSGYFMSSPGGDNLGGWQLNRGFNAAADFFPMSRFRDRFYRPDIVKLTLAKLDEQAAIEAADAALPDAANKKIPILAERLPPVIKILAPSDGAAIGPGPIALDYDVRSPSGLAVDSVELLFNGLPLDQRKPALPPGNAADPVRGTIEFRLPEGASGVVELGLVASAQGQRSLVSKVQLRVAVPPAPDDLLKPKLFALVVGISDYRIADLTPLQFAAKDAADFEVLLNRQRNGIYGPVEIRALTDSRATTGNIKDGLKWLSAHVTRRDVGVIYLAGHGQTDAHKRFWFLTSDTDKGRLAETALAKEDIDAVLQSLRGRVIVFLDACHSGHASGNGGTGSVDINALIGDLAASGRQMVIFSSSTGRELSYESPEWRNGVFTKSVIEAIAEGKADLFKTGRITSSLLDAYATKRVGDLTGGRQHPLMFRPEQSADFDIAAVR
jgi:WD40 repeat protein